MLRRRCCRAGSQGRTSTHRWVQATVTGTQQGALGLAGFRQAATATDKRRPVHGGSVQATVASRPDHRRHNGDAQTREGTSTLTWVPRSGQEEAKAAPLPRLKNTAAHGFRRSDVEGLAHANAKARSTGGYFHALGTHAMHTHTFWLCYARGGHARLTGEELGGDSTMHASRKKLRRCYWEGATAAHLGLLVDELERTVEEGDEGVVVGEED